MTMFRRLLKVKEKHAQTESVRSLRLLCTIEFLPCHY